MIRTPILLRYFVAWQQLLKAKYTGSDPLVAPKWIVRTKYDWEVSSERAISELGYKITSLETGFRKMIDQS